METYYLRSPNFAGTLVIGKNANCKQDVNIGDKKNEFLLTSYTLLALFEGEKLYFYFFFISADLYSLERCLK